MNLYKADTCLKRTKYLEPQVSALDRFYCNALAYVNNAIAVYDFSDRIVSYLYAKNKKKQNKMGPVYKNLFKFQIISPSPAF